MGLMHMTMAFNQQDLPRIAPFLQRVEGLSLEKSGQAPAAPEWQERQQQLSAQKERAVHLLDRLGLSLPKSGAQPASDAISDAQTAEDQLRRVEDAAQDLLSRRQEIENEIERLAETMHEMDRLNELTIALEEFTQFRYLAVRIGWVPGAVWNQIHVLPGLTAAALIPLLPSENRWLIMGAVVKNKTGRLERLLKEIHFQPARLPEDTSGTPQVVRAVSADRIRRLKEERSRIADDLHKRSTEWGRLLHAVIENIEIQLATARIMAQAGRIGEFISISGRVVSEDARRMLEQLSQEVQGPCAVFLVSQQGSGKRDNKGQ